MIAGFQSGSCRRQTWTHATTDDVAASDHAANTDAAGDDADAAGNDGQAHGHGAADHDVSAVARHCAELSECMRTNGDHHAWDS